MRQDRARDFSEATTETQHEQEDEDGSNRHQCSLKYIVVNPGENSSRRRVSERDAHPDPDTPTKSEPKDRVDDDAHCQCICSQVADDSDENRDGG